MTLPAISILLIPPLMQPLWCPEQHVFSGVVLDNAAHFSAARKASCPQDYHVWAEIRQSQYPGGSRASALACFGPDSLSQPSVAQCIFCRQITFELLGKSSISVCPSYLSCALSAAHRQPLCCALSSCRDFCPKTLLLPAMGVHFCCLWPQVVLVGLCSYIIYGHAASSSLPRVLESLEPSPISQFVSLSLVEK